MTRGIVVIPLNRTAGFRIRTGESDARLLAPSCGAGPLTSRSAGGRMPVPPPAAECPDRPRHGPRRRPARRDRDDRGAGAAQCHPRQHPSRQHGCRGPGQRGGAVREAVFNPRQLRADRPYTAGAVARRSCASSSTRSTTTASCASSTATADARGARREVVPIEKESTVVAIDGDIDAEHLR